MKFKVFLVCASIPVSGCLPHAGVTQNPKMSTVAAVENGLSVASFQCPFTQTRNIIFSDPNHPDVLTLDLIGVECEAAVLRSTVTTHQGEVIFATIAPVTTYIYDGNGPESTQRLLHDVTSSRLFDQNNVSHGQQLPLVNDILARPGFYDVNIVAYNKTVANDLPIFCHQNTATSTVCYVRLGGETVDIFETGS